MSKHLPAILLVVLLGLSACTEKPETVVTGDNPYEIASSIYRLQNRMSDDQRDRFSKAIDMLKMTTTDRYAAKSFTYVTPQLMMMVKGRTPRDIIQMATVYREAIPTLYFDDRPRGHRRPMGKPPVD